MKAILGGKDARSDENSRVYNPDLEIANNNFKIVKGLVLGFEGRRISPLFFYLRIPSSFIAFMTAGLSETRAMNEFTFDH